jgi:hypothetical protein
LVSATAVTAEATTTLSAGSIATSDTGSSFVGLKVLGFPLITDNVPVNTALSIAGIGTLYLRHEIATPHGLTVRMVELVLSSAVGPLPAGTDLIVASATATLRGA